MVCGSLSQTTPFEDGFVCGGDPAHAYVIPFGANMVVNDKVYIKGKGTMGHGY